MLGPGNIKTLSHATLYPVNRCAGVYHGATNFATRNDHDFTRSGDKVLAYDMPTAFPSMVSLHTLLHRRTLEDLLVSLTASERGAKILLDWNPYTACTEDQLASIDRPSLFIRKRINKRCGGTVYGARSDDKIGPCKSAGYLTGRRTIFEEYLPSSPAFPTLLAVPPSHSFSGSGSPVIPRAARSFAPAVLYYFMLAEQSFFSFFFCFPRNGRFGPNELRLLPAQR